MSLPFRSDRSRAEPSHQDDLADGLEGYYTTPRPPCAPKPPNGCSFDAWMRSWLEEAAARGLISGGVDERDSYRDPYRKSSPYTSYRYIVPPLIGPGTSADEAGNLRRGALAADLLRVLGPALLPALTEMLGPEIRRVAREILAGDLPGALDALGVSRLTAGRRPR